MAIVKSSSSLRASRDGGDDPLPDSCEIVSVDDSSGDLSTSSDDSNDSDSEDADSGMGSDSLDLSGLGEPSTELYQIGNHTVSLPLELNDFQDLSPLLNLETWNNCLSEEERFTLSEFLPDMDQETFSQTLKELFSGKNFHFGSPLSDLLTKLKGGSLDPRIVLYSRGLNCFKKHKYYHLLRDYHNSMVGSLERIRDAWRDCSGYGIEERLRILNILRSRRSLGYEREAGSVLSETDSESGNLAEEFWSRSAKMNHQSMRFVKDDAKGILKVTPPKVSAKMEYTSIAKTAVRKTSKASKGLLSFPRHPMRTSDGCNNVTVGNDDDDDDDEMEEHRYEMSTGAKLLKHRKKESHVEMLPYDRKVRTIDQGVTIASFNPHSLETMSKARYSGKDWMYPPKDWSQHQSSVGSQLIKSEELNVRGKKLTGEVDSRTGLSKTGFDMKARSYKALPALVGDPYLYSANRAKVRQAKIKSKYSHDGRLGMGFPRGSTAQSEETESDSSEKVEKDGEAYSFAKKVGYPSGVMEGQHPGLVKPTFDVKKSSKLAEADKQLRSSILTPEFKPYSIKEKKKSKTTDPNCLQDIVVVKKSPVSHPSEKVQQPPPKINVSDKKRKGAIKQDRYPNMMGDHGSGKMKENKEYLNESSQFLDSPVQVNRAGNRYHVTDDDHIERSNMPLLMCNSVTKKRKGKADGINQDEMEDAVYLQYSPMQQIDKSNFIKKKGKRKADAACPLLVAAPDTVIPEKETADVEPETKPQKKPFTLITPTKHTGFSFSIIHLLSAVRKAMITTHMEDAAGIGNHLEKGDARLKQKSEDEMLPTVNGTQLLNTDKIASQEAGQNNLPCLTVQEIVNRVRTNPGDPCILETQEPLQDLVRGVLKIFSSKTAPLGAKGWKVLLSYEKSNKSWCWIGPVSSSSSDNDTVEEETSSEAWGIPHKMLVKLVDAFSNWLQSGQETLRQIGSLPAPPIAMLPELDEKERFRDLRAQKSLSTISPSTEEVRAYFHKEELLRYLIPDRAFSYTAADGKKSIVASLRRGGGKPTSRARDHFMLKPDRPPHVTILCLVRDAAARLPGSIGTRADVCTLIRDSQYIVEDVTDAQVNQVVSGALDRLHYERDPCVQFDSDRKLWVYLHRDREEEDFEDDGTSSTKKWKRQRKDATDQSDTGAANDVSCHATGDPSVSGSARYDFNPDHNVDSLSFQAGINEPMYNDLRSNMDYFHPLIVDPLAGDRGQGNPMGWEALGLNTLQENKLLCQENSTNEDFEDEAFSRERPVGILSATLL